MGVVALLDKVPKPQKSNLTAEGEWLVQSVSELNAVSPVDLRVDEKTWDIYVDYQADVQLEVVLAVAQHLEQISKLGDRKYRTIANGDEYADATWFRGVLDIQNMTEIPEPGAGGSLPGDDAEQISEVGVDSFAPLPVVGGRPGISFSLGIGGPVDTQGIPGNRLTGP